VGSWREYFWGPRRRARIPRQGGGTEGVVGAVDRHDVLAAAEGRAGAAPRDDLGFGRTVASEIEAPILLVNLL
jgi:hypothetical protein